METKCIQQKLDEFSIFSDILKIAWGKITEVGFWSVWTPDFIKLAETLNILFSESWLWAFSKWRVLLGLILMMNILQLLQGWNFFSDVYPH